MEDKTCSIEQCDIFDFMANHVGLIVIHPGGTSTSIDAVIIHFADPPYFLVMQVV